VLVAALSASSVVLADDVGRELAGWEVGGGRKRARTPGRRFAGPRRRS